MQLGFFFPPVDFKKNSFGCLKKSIFFILACSLYLWYRAINITLKILSGCIFSPLSLCQLPLALSPSDPSAILCGAVFLNSGHMVIDLGGSARFLINSLVNMHRCARHSP